MSNEYLVQVTSCTIGTKTFSEIQYHAHRPVGTGSGGVTVSPRFVANTVLPVGVTPHHIYYEVQICIDSDYKDILSLTSVMSPGTAVNPVTVTEKAASGKTRTVTYNSAYFQSCEPIKIENEAEHQYFVVNLLCLAAPTFGDWA